MLIWFLFGAIYHGYVGERAGKTLPAGCRSPPRSREVPGMLRVLLRTLLVVCRVLGVLVFIGEGFEV